MQRLCAVVTCTDIDTVCIEYRCNVVRVNIVDSEREYAVMIKRIVSADNVYVRHFFHLVKRKSCKLFLTLLYRIKAKLIDVIYRCGKTDCAADIYSSCLEFMRQFGVGRIFTGDIFDHFTA